MMDREFLNQVSLKIKTPKLDKVSVPVSEPKAQVRYRYPSRILRLTFVLSILVAIMFSMKYGCESYFAIERGTGRIPMGDVVKEFEQYLKEN
jgi:hypothetical protein